MRPTLSQETKTCSICGTEKPLTTEFFSIRKDRACGWRAMCKECRRINRKYDPLKERIYNLKRYGLTIQDWADMFYKQAGKCKICGIDHSELSRKLCVDHCHETGKVRGLLCDSCNLILGKAKDNTDILKKAIEYLENE